MSNSGDFLSVFQSLVCDNTKIICQKDKYSLTLHQKYDKIKKLSCKDRLS